MKKLFISILTTLISSLTFAQLTPMSIGIIEPGDSIMIYFSVRINNPFPNGPTHIASQGTISGSNIVTSKTDDPDTGTPGDSTFTPVINNQPPVFVNGASTTLNVCQNSINISLNSLLSATDPDIGQTLTWTIVTGPTQGTANGFPTGRPPHR